MTDGLLYRLVRSAWNYWSSFGLDVVLGIAMIAGGFAGHGFGPGAAAVFAGWLFFTFIEYAIHRWGYHGPDSPLTVVHRFHHADGATLVGAPFFYPLAITAVVVAGAHLVVPSWIAAAFAGTVLVAYEAQGFVHAFAHGWPGARWLRAGRIVKRLRRHHMVHHAGDGTVNFGMTTALWDRVFGTYAERVRA